MRQAYDYWQDQPGSCLWPRAGRVGQAQTPADGGTNSDRGAEAPRERVHKGTAQFLSKHVLGTGPGGGATQGSPAPPGTEPRREASMKRSTSTHQRVGDNSLDRQSGDTLHQPRAPPAGAAVAPASSSRQAPPRGGEAGQSRTGSRLRVTRAHRVAAQAPHRPPTRGTRHKGGASFAELALRKQTLRDGVGGLIRRPQKLPGSARHVSRSPISYWGAGCTAGTRPAAR